MRLAAALALLPAPALADLALIRAESGPRVFQAEAADLAAMALEPGAEGGTALVVTLAPGRWAGWLAFTTDSAGEPLALSVCDAQVGAPAPAAPVADGRIAIPDPGGEGRLVLLDRLAAGACPP